MEEKEKTDEQFWQGAEKNHKRGKILGGLLFVIIGSLFLARELGMVIPQWIFTWKTLLIGIGLVIAVKSNFRSWKWIILVAIGTAYLICDLYPGLAIRPLLWPMFIILIGLIIIFKPRRKHHFKNKMYRKYYKHHSRYYNYAYDYTDRMQAQSTNEDVIESTTFMAEVKKNIISKNFKGGDITNVLGGTEINLSQADFEGSPVLEITNVLGGTKLIIPAHWEIHSELVSVMGSIEDKRPIQSNITAEKNKILILKGTVFMGGIEINSY
jgi:predicted membrane protein